MGILTSTQTNTNRATSYKTYVTKGKIRDKHPINENTLRGDFPYLEKPILGIVIVPPRGIQRAPLPAKVGRAGSGTNAVTIDPQGNIGWPIAMVQGSFGADFKAYFEAVKYNVRGQTVGEFGFACPG